jgi:hypothetical protein
MSLHIPVDQAIPKARPVLDSAKGREALASKRAEWDTLNLRQDFADSAYLRQILSSASVRIAYNTEPATAARVKSVLWRAGLSASHIVRAVGTTAAGFLQKNPNLPTWAAVALILEATGNFNPKDPK